MIKYPHRSSFAMHNANYMGRFAILLVILLAGCSEQKAPQSTMASPSSKSSTSPERETWDACCLQGARVGYVHTRVYRDQLDGQPVERIECLNQIEVQRYGQASQMKIQFTSVEKPDGGLLRFESELQMGPQPVRTTGRVIGKRLEMETVAQGKSIPSSLDWSPEFGGFFALEQSLLHRPMEPGQRRTIHSLQPETNQLADSVLSACDWEQAPLLHETKELLRIDVEVSLPGVRIKPRFAVWTDRRGEILKTHLDAMNMDSFRTTEAEALKKNEGELFDINIRTAVKLDRPIPNAYETRKIRYRLHLEGEDPLKAFPPGPTQQIKSIDANTAELTVFSIRSGRKDGNLDAPADPPGDADRLRNSMVQSDDPLVVSLAEEAAGEETDPWQTAMKLEKFVHGYIKLKNFSQVFASAAEAAKSREGDCTEHAVLLAALCRARRFPLARPSDCYIPSVEPPKAFRRSSPIICGRKRISAAAGFPSTPRLAAAASGPRI